jgi:ankyrin repeat protein/Cdc6-like AAA superfamily ATPase
LTSVAQSSPRRQVAVLFKAQALWVRRPNQLSKMAEIGLAASIISVLQLANDLIKYIQSVRSASEERKALVEELIAVADLLQPFRDRENLDNSLQNGNIQMLELSNPLSILQGTLQELSIKLGPRSRLKEVGKALTWSFEKSDIKELLQRIERQKATIMLVLQNSQIDQSSKILVGVTGIEQGVAALNISKKLEDNEKVIDWLSDLNFATTQNDTFSRRYDMTGEWLLEDKSFLTWRDGNGLLWCPGLPGVGKTVLTSIVIDHLEGMTTEQVGLAYIYCNYKAPNHTALNLVSALLQQLVRQKSTLPEDVEGLYKRHIKKRTRPSLKELKLVFESVLKSFEKVYIIIDALDECREDGSRQDFLRSLREVEGHAQLFITSRRIHGIVSGFKKMKTLDIYARSEDISSYVRGRMLDPDYRLYKLVQNDMSLQDTIVQSVTSTAQGMFLLAYFHMESLVKKPSVRLLRKALENLPTEIEGSYDGILERIWQQDVDDVDIAKKVLSWICYATRPLSVIEIQHALAIESGDTELDEEALMPEDLLISVCAGLVTVNRENKIIRLVHYTAEEYFKRARDSKLPGAQNMITATCITYLSLQGCLPAISDEDSASTLWSQIEEYPLLQYVLPNWGVHAQGEPEITSQEQILALLTDPSRLESCIQLNIFLRQGHFQYIKSAITPLHAAAYYGLATIAEILLKTNSLASQDIYERKPLLVAARRGNVKVVDLLSKLDPDINAHDKYGMTPLHWSSKNGHADVVNSLLHGGADHSIRAFDEYEGATALCFAGQSGYAEVVRLLIANGADLEARFSGWGQTTLQEAAFQQKESVVRVLLDAGADINARDGPRLAPALFWATEARNLSIVKIFLEPKYDVDLRLMQSNGQRVLHWVANNEVLTRLFLGTIAREDIDAKDTFDSTPLICATEKGYVEVAKALVENGADVNAGSMNGKSAFDLALQVGNEELLLLLVKNSARPILQWDENSPSVREWENETWFADLLALLHNTETKEDIPTELVAESSRNELISFDEDSAPKPYVQVTLPPSFQKASTIVIVTRSHDQGWSSYPEEQGTYHGSQTFFSVEAKSATGEPKGSLVFQYNIHGSSKTREHTNILSSRASSAKELIDKLQAGDVIQVIPQARYAGWVNYVEGVDLRVLAHKSDNIPLLQTSVVAADKKPETIIKELERTS